MLLDKITISNYMLHKNTTLELRPVSILFGGNGSGKSAFLDALLNFSTLSSRDIAQAFGVYPFSFKETLHREARENGRIGFDVEFKLDSTDYHNCRYEVNYSIVNNQPVIHNESLKCDNRLLYDRATCHKDDCLASVIVPESKSLFAALRKATADDPDNILKTQLVITAQRFSKINKFRLEPFELSAPSALPDLPGENDKIGYYKLGYHGELLSSLLYSFSETNVELLEEIANHIRVIDNSFIGFEFNIVGPDRVGFSAVYNDCRGRVTAARLSSGMLHYIGLITLLLQPNRPSILMIEEPENGLTAQAIVSFYKLAKAVAIKENSTMQIVISSHSPFLLEEAFNRNDDDMLYRLRAQHASCIAEQMTIDGMKDRISLRNENQIGLRNAAEFMSGYYLNDDAQ